MYRNPPPAQSPPLHHPVPQHVSTVPQLRSPPPNIPSANSAAHGYGGYAPGPQQQQQQQQGGYAQPSFGGFMNDQTAQMGFQVGKTAVMAGQEYVEQNFSRYVPVSALKHYFNVSNSYVASKLLIVLFPWRHKPWVRRTAGSTPGAAPGSGAAAGGGAPGGDSAAALYLPPRDDVNSPDMYIPAMAFVTYILLTALLAGLRGAFEPELLGLTASAATGVVALELAALKLGCYLLGLGGGGTLLDLLAYSGYKFVGVIATTVAGELASGGRGTGGYVGWAVFAYTFLALAFFLLRSLRYVLLPEHSLAPAAAMHTGARAQRSRRSYFLFAYSYGAQLLFMWVLSRQDAPAAAPLVK